MATLSHAHLNDAWHTRSVHKSDKMFGGLMPRRCMVISTALILAGLTIPLLMAIDCLQPSFALGFLGWAMVTLGGYRFLTRCGEL